MSVSPLLHVVMKDAGLGDRFSGRLPRLTTSDGRQLFAKSSKTEHNQIRAESESLKAMAAVEPTLLPQIYAAGERDGEAYLVTEYKSTGGSRSDAVQAELGRKLAQMHRNGTNERFGFHVPTFCGVTRQDNTWETSWKTFFVDRRIGDLIQRLGDRELSKLHEKLQTRGYDLLFDSLDVKPAILHGDLWSGNVGVDENGKPFIFDPSSYYGHGEADLGIARMFGGFRDAFFDAYHNELPRSSGPYEQRLQLYQCYHHLNHALMFGGTYRSGALRLLQDLVDWAEREPHL